MKYFKFIILAILLSLVFNNSAYAEEESSQESIIADFANKTFDIKLDDGSSILSDDTKREEYNLKIYQKDLDKEISLYDRFGGNIRFVPYLGEKKFEITVVDKIYNAYIDGIDNDEGFKINPMEIFKSEGAQTDNVVYENRPDIITEERYETGSKDPRRDAYTIMSNDSGTAFLGNMYLSASNMITEFVVYLSGRGLYDSIWDIWDFIVESGFFEFVSSMFMYLVPIATIFFVLKLVKFIKNIAEGSRTIGDVLTRTLSFMISLGIIYAVSANPNAIKPISSFVIETTDSLFDRALTINATEVSKSDDEDNLLISSLWKITVLDPWAKGMFDGRTYDELYTQYSDKPNRKKLPQSNDNISVSWEESEDETDLRYSSATLTGDVKVPLGKDKYTQNWAALAWSTQSKYHINAVESESENLTENEAGEQWRRADTTPRNTSMYVDNFRWLDAKLNISPGFSSVQNHNGSYEKSRPYKTAFFFRGLESFFLALLLLPTLIPIFRKLANLLLILISSIRWAYYSLLNIFDVESNAHNPIENLKKVLHPLFDFYWWSMVLYIMFFIYSKMVGTVLGNIMWIFLAVVIIKYRPARPNRILRDLKRKARTAFTNIGKK